MILQQLVTLVWTKLLNAYAGMHFAFWINMATDIAEHCRQCVKCQQSKHNMPQGAPLQNTPIGQPWQMVAVEIL